MCYDVMTFTYNRIITSNFSVLHRYPPISPDPQEWETAMWELEEKISQKKREVEKWYFDDAYIYIHIYTYINTYIHTINKLIYL